MDLNAKINNIQCTNCSRVYTKDTDFLKNTRGWSVGNDYHLWFHCSCGAFLSLPMSDFDSPTPKRGVSEDAFRVFRTMVVPNNLPHIPEKTKKIISLLNAEDFSLPKVGKELKTAPLLSVYTLDVAKKLKDLRSPEAPAIAELEHAIAYMGTKVFGGILKIASLNALRVKSKQLDVKAYWKKALMCGYFAESILQRFYDKFFIDGIPMHFEKLFPFLAGSFSNIGLLAAALVKPEDVDKMQEIVNNPREAKPYFQIEAEQFEWNSMVLGEIATLVWELPDFVVEACRYPQLILDSDTPLGLRELIHLSNAMVNWSQLEPHLIDRGIFSYLCDRLGFGDEGTLGDIILSDPKLDFCL